MHFSKQDCPKTSETQRRKIMTFLSVNLILILRWIYTVSSINTGPNCYTLSYNPSAVYTGNKAFTLYGTECQRWDSQFPHRHKFIKDYMFPDKSVKDAENYCRDPDGSGFPWCFTTMFSIKWDTCGISKCQGNECYYIRNGHAIYEGMQNSNTFTICQRWDSQSPHKHNFTNPGLFNVKRLSDVANYCRDPDGTGVPWCFSNSPKKGRVPCATGRCKDCFSIRDHNAMYFGYREYTRSGLRCQRWDQHIDKGKSSPTYAFPDRICRDPDSRGEPWCYTERKTPMWETCGILPCPETECYTKVNNTILYQGSTSVTVFGYECQRWDWDFPHKHKYNSSKYFPEQMLAETANYCRDPSKMGFLWCYTTNPEKRWDQCGVPACKDIECYIKIHDRIVYSGSISVTKKGYICQQWISDYPHNHLYIQSASMNTDRKGLFKNYCRDPSHDGYLWCYTTNPKVRWGKCDVPAC